MKQPNPGRILSLAALAALVFPACNGGGSPPQGGVSPINPGGKFLVMKTEPLNNGRLFLNDPIRIDFSTPVDLTSADLNTFSFQVLDQNGNPVTEQPAGTFATDVSPGDSLPGRRLLFKPRLPSNDTYDNGGFRPGRTYLVQLVGGDQRNGNVLRDINGKGLSVPVTFQFSTADGTSPAQLFRDTLAGGPRRLGYQITPEPDAQGVALNKLGLAPVEIRLQFDQQLNPHSSNVPVSLDTNPLLRSVNDKGRIFLEYDNPISATQSVTTWIPANVELDNDNFPSSVVLRPVGVLPNNADIRVIVENTLEDISGESNVANPAYDRVFTTFHTRSSYDAQFDAVVEDFATSNAVDFDAPFLEPQADVEAGFVRAGFDFAGTTTTMEFEPNVPEVVLDTDFTQVVPKNGAPFNVSGGVFNFRSVFIPAGVTVNGIGRNPMVWLCSGNFEVAGLLSVRGGHGQRVNTLNSANFPAGGGAGVCGGGNGGDGSPSGTSRDMTGQAGYGPGQRPGGGGRAGRISCAANCGRGSGGGGGSLATQGDPNYFGNGAANQPTSFQQKRGIGGQGCNGASGNVARSLSGGEAGPLVFSDARTDNNFWGSAINLNQQVRVVGELATPTGGGGGGGGGDYAVSGGCNPLEQNWIVDPKGGGGGGGGGVLIVKALGNIIIDATGRITADGGSGGGGEQAGSCNYGGGGGGGAGGMVILQAGGQIILNAKGAGSGATARYCYGPHAQVGTARDLGSDYGFCVSADGGVCLTGTFGTPVVDRKYPNTGTAISPSYGTTYDAAPLGAFGGMGVVQLMAPPGDATGTAGGPDGTNTFLDDNIEVFAGGTRITGIQKQWILAWRGFPNANGVMVDDEGNPTDVGDNEGDIRPSPILLPVTYSTKSRVRSKWIDTGASSRRALTVEDGLPRGIVEGNGFLAGPRYEFAGTIDNLGQPSHGYANFVSQGDSVRAVYPEMLATGGVDMLSASSATIDYQGQAAYKFTLAQASLGAVDNLYSQYEAVVFDGPNSEYGSYRILAHNATELWVSAEAGSRQPPASVAGFKLQVLAKFFQLKVDGVESFGRTFRGSAVVPVSNVRIGFAFSSSPTDPTQRFPLDPNSFVFDLTNPTVQEQIRALHKSFMQWDVVFDTAYPSTIGELPSPATPDLTAPRTELHFLRIPFRF